MSKKAVCSESAMSRTNSTLTIHQAHELIQRLEKAGSFNSRWAQMIIQNDDYARRIVSFIQEGGQQETASQQQAREIMGERFLGVREVAEHLGIILMTDELKRIAAIPFKEETLQRYKETHLLFLGVNHNPDGHFLTINKLRLMFPRGGNPQFYLYKEDKGSWFDLQNFAIITRPQLGWYFIRTDILEDSRSKGFNEQMKLLQPNEYLENAVLYVYAKILFYLARGITIFKNTWTRCGDLRGKGQKNHTCIGYYGGPYGLCCNIGIGFGYDSEEGYQMGIAPAIKPDN